MVLFVPNHVPVISLCTGIVTFLQFYRIGMKLFFSFIVLCIAIMDVVVVSDSVLMLWMLFGYIDYWLVD